MSLRFWFFLSYLITTVNEPVNQVLHRYSLQCIKGSKCDQISAWDNQLGRIVVATTICGNRVYEKTNFLKVWDRKVLKFCCEELHNCMDNLQKGGAVSSNGFKTFNNNKLLSMMEKTSFCPKLTAVLKLNQLKQAPKNCPDNC